MSSDDGRGVQTPLTDLLKSVPEYAVYEFTRYDDKGALICTASFPVGWLTHKAAALIESQAAEIERLRAPSWVEYIEITRNWLAKYPPDVFTGETGESGPLFVVSVRQALAELDATQEQSE